MQTGFKLTTNDWLKIYQDSIMDFKEKMKEWQSLQSHVK